MHVKKALPIFLLPSLFILLFSLPTSSSAKEAPLPAHYQQKESSRDGTGKFYMGREISKVMGHLGAGWLERPERVQQEHTDLLIENLEPITLSDARERNNHFILRWRNRTCRLCGTNFDISLGGFGYTCPDCQKMEAPQ